MSGFFYEMPSCSYLHECFEYLDDLGSLKWRERPIDHFDERAIMQSPESIQKMWNRQRAGKLFGTPSRGVITGKINNIQYFAHRIIFKMHYEREPIDIIHLDNDGTNNRIENIVEATRETITKTTCVPTTRTGSGIVGVCYQRTLGKWEAFYSINGKQIALGRFHSREEAIAARSDAEHQDKTRERVMEELAAQAQDLGMGY